MLCSQGALEIVISKKNSYFLTQGFVDGSFSVVFVSLPPVKVFPPFVEVQPPGTIETKSLVPTFVVPNVGSLVWSVGRTGGGRVDPGDGVLQGSVVD